MSRPRIIDYAGQPPHVWRRSLLRAVLWGALVGLLLSSWWWLGALWRHGEMLYWQHRCMVYLPPRGQAALRFGNGRMTPFIPTEWTNFYRLISPTGFKSDGTVFLHEMRTPHGQRRLVVVDLEPSLFGPLALGPSSRVFSPADLFSSPVEVDSVYELWPQVDVEQHHGSIDCGSVDPEDSTHFTVRGTIDARPVTWDGWLRDDNSVLIVERKQKRANP